MTLQTIADALGVSRTTVSNAYNRPDQLAPELRRKVLETAKELGYAGPDPAARRLRSGRRGAIGLMFSERLSYAFTDPGAVGFLQGLTEATEAKGYELLLLPGMRGEEHRGRGGARRRRGRVLPVLHARRPPGRRGGARAPPAGRDRGRAALARQLLRRDRRRGGRPARRGARRRARAPARDDHHRPHHRRPLRGLRRRGAGRRLDVQGQPRADRRLPQGPADERADPGLRDAGQLPGGGRPRRARRAHVLAAPDRAPLLHRRAGARGARRRARAGPGRPRRRLGHRLRRRPGRRDRAAHHRAPAAAGEGPRGGPAADGPGHRARGRAAARARRRAARPALPPA